MDLFEMGLECVLFVLWEHKPGVFKWGMLCDASWKYRKVCYVMFIVNRGVCGCIYSITGVVSPVCCVVVL